MYNKKDVIINKTNKYAFFKHGTSHKVKHYDTEILKVTAKGNITKCLPVSWSSTFLINKALKQLGIKDYNLDEISKRLNGYSVKELRQIWKENMFYTS